MIVSMNFPNLKGKIDKSSKFRPVDWPSFHRVRSGQWRAVHRAAPRNSLLCLPFASAFVFPARTFPMGPFLFRAEMPKRKFQDFCC